MTARPIRDLADVHVLGLGVTIDLKLITPRQLDIFCRHYNLQSGTAFTDARQIPEEQRHLLFENTESLSPVRQGAERREARRLTPHGAVPPRPVASQWIFCLQCISP